MDTIACGLRLMVNDDDEEEELEEVGQHRRRNLKWVRAEASVQPTSSPKPSRTASGGGRGGALVRKEAR